MEFDPRFEANAHPELVRLANIWREFSGLGRMPHRDAIYAPKFQRWSPGHLYLVDVLDGGANYFFRLFGEYFTALAGIDLTRRYLSEIEMSPLRLESLRVEYDEIVRSGVPLYQPGSLVWPNQEEVYHERLHLPFSGSDGSVSLIVGSTQSETAIEDLIIFQGGGSPTLVLEEALPLISTVPA